MKNATKIIAMLLLIVLAASGCKAPEPVQEEPSETPEPTEAPTPFQPTQVPTATPRQVDGEVERPGPEETPLLIDPVDKPTIPPIVFEPYVTYTSPTMNVSFEIPSYFQLDEANSTENTLVFMEPMNEIRSHEKVRASLTIAISTHATEQTEREADLALDSFIDTLRSSEFLQNVEVSSKADNSMLDVKGRYITFWVDQEAEDGSGEMVKMRGRCLMLPKGTRMYQVRFMCPRFYNTQYEDGVYKKIRATFTEL